MMSTKLAFRAENALEIIESKKAQIDHFNNSSGYKQSNALHF